MWRHVYCKCFLWLVCSSARWPEQYGVSTTFRPNVETIYVECTAVTSIRRFLVHKFRSYLMIIIRKFLRSWRKLGQWGMGRILAARLSERICPKSIHNYCRVISANVHDSCAVGMAAVTSGERRRTIGWYMSYWAIYTRKWINHFWFHEWMSVMEYHGQVFSYSYTIAMSCLEQNPQEPTNYTNWRTIFLSPLRSIVTASFAVVPHIELMHMKLRPLPPLLNTRR